MPWPHSDTRTVPTEPAELGPRWDVLTAHQVSPSGLVPAPESRPGSFQKCYKPADITSRWEYLHHGNWRMLQIGVVSCAGVLVTLYRCQHDVSPCSRGGDVLAPVPRPPHTPTGSGLNTHTLFLGHEHLYLPGPEQPHPRDVLTRDKVRPQCEGAGSGHTHGPRAAHRYTTAGSSMLATSTLYSSRGGLSLVSGEDTRMWKQV